MGTGNNSVDWRRGRSRRLPVEGGLVGVWFSSLVYGLVMIASNKSFSWQALLALVLAVAALPLAGYAWKNTIGKRVLAAIAYSVPAGYLVYAVGGPKLLALLAAYTLILLAATTRGGLLLIVAGGGLLGETGGLLALTANPHPLPVLLPGIYSLASVSTAALRVVGGRRPFLLSLTASLAAAALGALIAVRTGECLACLVLAGDSIARFLLVAFGPGKKLGVRTYGFAEAVHSPIILGVLALLLH